MCGRARCSLSREAVAAAAGVRWQDGDHYRPSYNCSPGAWLPIICLGPDGVRALRTMKWGLVPSFTRLTPGERPDHYRMFNARCESLAEKPVFSRLLPRRRCVAVLEGFYEWLSQGSGRKQPYHVSTVDPPARPAMYLAGLYDVCKDSHGEPLYTFTVVTTDSSKQLAWLHDRMPVILTTDEEVAEWLGEQTTPPTTTTTTPSGVKHAITHPNTTATAPNTTRGSSPPTAGHDRLHEATLTHGTVAGGGSGGDAAAHCDTSTARGSQRGGGGDGGQSRKATVDIDLTQTSDEQEEGHGDGAGGERRLSPKGAEDAGTGVRGSGAVRGRDGKGHRGWEEGGLQDSAVLVERLCRPYGGPLLRWHPVTLEMSKPGYDKPDACQDVRTRKGSIAFFFKPPTKGGSSCAATSAAGQSPAAPATTGTKIKTEPIKSEPSGSPRARFGAAASGPLRTPAAALGAIRLAVKEEGLGVKQETAAEATEARNPDECPAAGGSVGVEAPEGAVGTAGLGWSLEKGKGGAVGGTGVAGGHKRLAEGAAVPQGQGIMVKKEKK